MIDSERTTIQPERSALTGERLLALGLMLATLAGCGGKVRQNEVSADARPKPSAAKVEQKPTLASAKEKKDVVTGAKDTAAGEEAIDGSLRGFPLECAISDSGSVGFEITLANTHSEAASGFKVWLSALAINRDTGQVSQVMPTSIEAEGLRVKSVKMSPETPGEQEYTIEQVESPGLEAGDTLNINADLPGATTVHVLAMPKDPKGESLKCDKVYDASVEG